MKPFDLNAALDGAKLVTKDGNPARLICTDRQHQYRFIWLEQDERGTEYVSTGDYDVLCNFLRIADDESVAQPKPEPEHEGIIRTQIFFDENGERTCALDFEKGVVCEFYRTQHFGTHETCLFAPSAGKRSEKLERRGSDGLGLLIPGKWCPLKAE